MPALMNTYIPSLFDDEDFFPKEPPKKKPEKKVKEVANVPASDADISTENKKDSKETRSPSPTTNTDENIQGDAPFIEQAPEQPTSIAGKASPTDTEIIEKTKENEVIKAADDELKKQILSELIQVDYASLIHKDYPFDINNAKVIKKEKPAPIVVEEVPVEEVVPLPEWNLNKHYYPIGEVAQMFGVNTSHIRFWTTEFKMKPRTTRKGDRLYNPKDIAELRLIHHLVKEKKHTIKGAREKLKAGKDGVNNKIDLKESLIGLKNMLVQIKDQL